MFEVLECGKYLTTLPLRRLPLFPSIMERHGSLFTKEGIYNLARLYWSLVLPVVPGSAAIQLAKATGAMVIAVAGGAEKTKQAEFLGADHVIDHQINGDWVDEVRELSNGGVDIAYDPVGGDTTHQVRRCMAWDGRLLIIGFVAGIPDLPANHMLLKNYSVVGVHWGASLGRDPQSLNNQMHSIIELAEKGFVDPLIFKPYEFENGAVAIQDLADRKTWGKVIVRVG